jgi:hypothetical protein
VSLKFGSALYNRIFVFTPVSGSVVVAPSACWYLVRSEGGFVHHYKYLHHYVIC